MYTQAEIEKISSGEKRQKRKLTRDELEDILDRDITRLEWGDYRDKFVYPIIQEVSEYEEYSDINKTRKLNEKLNKESSIEGGMP